METMNKASESASQACLHMGTKSKIPLATQAAAHVANTTHPITTGPAKGTRRRQCEVSVQRHQEEEVVDCQNYRGHHAGTRNLYGTSMPYPSFHHHHPSSIH